MAKWIEKQYQTTPLGAVVENSMASGSVVNAPSINAVKNAFSNPNLLINSDFRNCYQTTVNQRRLSSYAYAGAKTYTVDRWALSGSEDGKSTLALHADHIAFTKTGGIYVTLMQQFETPLSSEKGFTVSCEVSSGISLVIGTNPITVYDLVAGVNVVNISPNVSFDMIYFYMETNNITVDIKWVKLEQGSIATPFVPKPYQEELALCQRYYIYIQTMGVRSKTLSDIAFEVRGVLPHTMRSTPTLTLYSAMYRSDTGAGLNARTINPFAITNQDFAANLYFDHVISGACFGAWIWGTADAEIY